MITTCLLWAAASCASYFRLNESQFFSQVGESSTILFCSFENIHNSANGGAFSIDSAINAMVVDHSIFTNCTSDVNGGGFFIGSPTVQVSLSCFYLCYCVNMGTGIHIAGNSSNCQLFMLASSNPKPYSMSLAISRDFSIDSTNATARFLNSTCSCNRGTTSFHAEVSPSTTIKYVNIMNTIGGQSISFRRTTLDDEVSYVNVINNTDSSMIFFADGTVAAVKNWIIIQTSATFAINMTNNYVTVVDCIFDLSSQTVTVSGIVISISNLAYASKPSTIPLSTVWTGACVGCHITLQFTAKLPTARSVPVLFAFEMADSFF